MAQSFVEFGNENLTAKAAKIYAMFAKFFLKLDFNMLAKLQSR